MGMLVNFEYRAITVLTSTLLTIIKSLYNIMNSCYYASGNVIAMFTNLPMTSLNKIHIAGVILYIVMGIQVILTTRTI